MANNVFNPTTGRRGLMGLLSRAGMVTVAAAAGLTATGQAGFAHTGPGCCDLLYTDAAHTCGGSGINWPCPSGYTKFSWTCCQAGALYGCGECIKGPASSCWNASSSNTICSKRYLIANPAGCGP